MALAQRTDLLVARKQGSQTAVTQWDKHHQVIYHDTATYAGAYHRAMKQFDSILIEAN